ncbi:MAG: tripartite tricarboxylate transporter substrate-binding protein [Hyphomicrobium sp.]
MRPRPSPISSQWRRPNPDKLFYASSGNGSAQHLAGELFKLRTGTDIGHIPYKGGGPAVADVAAGHVPFYFGNMSAAWPQAQAGRVRALAVTSAERSPAAPEVPTIGEAGVKNCEISEWNAILVPAGTPPEVQARLQGRARPDHAHGRHQEEVRRSRRRHDRLDPAGTGGVPEVRDGQVGRGRESPADIKIE